MKQAKNILLGFVLLVLLCPLLQSFLNVCTLNALDGDVHLAPDTSITTETWFNSEYQNIKEKYLNDNFGFRNFYVRLRNQVHFSFFNKVHAKEVIAGKSGFLYEQKYLETHAGMDYLGDDIIKRTLYKVKFVQDTLQKMGITFAILFAPGKSTFYSEYIPSPYNVENVKTNYAQFTSEAVRMGINQIDYNKLFLSLKKSSKYPLYPQTGTHWSIYGMHLALDTLVGYIESKTGKRLPHFDYTKVEMSDTLRHPDGDIAAGLNLLREPPHFTMAYPDVKWKDTAGAWRPQVLTISDSYWMGVYFTELPMKVFKNHEFWYYNKMLYNYNPEGKYGDPTDYDLKASIEKNNCIFIMSTEATLKCIGWGIIDELYEMYSQNKYSYELNKKNRKKTSEINQVRSIAWNDPEWFGKIKEQAEKLSISVDSCVKINAEFYYNEKHKNDPPLVIAPEQAMYERVLKIKAKMLDSREWYAYLVKKAADMKISIDSCIGMDARWSADQEIFKERVEYFKNQIRNTPKWLNDVAIKAKQWNISTDSCVALDAIYLAKQELIKK